jgi:hypothetical protein
VLTAVRREAGSSCVVARCDAAALSAVPAVAGCEAAAAWEAVPAGRCEAAASRTVTMCWAAGA